MNIQDVSFPPIKVQDDAWRAYCADLEEGEKNGKCSLCRRALRQWSDLCDDCADAFQDLADALNPDDDSVYFVERS